VTSTLLLRVLERIHGHLGWLAIAALSHPAILLRRLQRRARLSVALATTTAVATALLGARIYPSYREQLKQRIFIEHPALGWSFERKEHLAVGAIAFALTGCLAHFAVPMFQPPARDHVARLAHRSFVASFVLATIVGLLGIAVAAYKSF
jgi:hypothetical protein